MGAITILFFNGSPRKLKGLNRKLVFAFSGIGLPLRLITVGAPLKQVGTLPSSIRSRRREGLLRFYTPSQCIWLPDRLPPHHRVKHNRRLSPDSLTWREDWI
jgi:hypothetical protein